MIRKKEAGNNLADAADASQQLGGTPRRKYHKKINYAKYGYLFLIPFFLVFLIFQLVPLGQTFYYSLFEYYFKLGITAVGPNFNNFQNFITLLAPGSVFWKYLGNTMLIWIIGFVPQIILSLILAVWFTDSRLKMKCSGFFKAVMYMPNLVMASAFGMMFQMFFAQSGPVNQILMDLGVIAKDSPIMFLQNTTSVRLIIAFINWIMWFGNTTILIMSGIMGIDESIFESARLDGANASRTFWQVTMPLLKPIFVYVVITSLIGGLQLFDAPQLFTNSGVNNPNDSATTIMMWLYTMIRTSKNYGMAGALSVIIFIFTGILSIFVFKTMVPSYNAIKAESKSYKKRMKEYKTDSHVMLTNGLLAKDQGGNL
ncbi:MAG: sugar ABC transporter permease [Bacilli bacterium]|jgi:multiple sugar transport system permease protein